MNEFTPEQQYAAALHSVSLIDTLLQETVPTPESLDRIKANAQHLQTMIAKSIWTATQIATCQTAVDKAKTLVDIGTTPPVTVPQAVSMRQARLALLAAGLLQKVESVIVDPAAKIEWDYATEVLRTSGLVPQMATMLGLTDTQIDDLFIAASKL